MGMGKGTEVLREARGAALLFGGHREQGARKAGWGRGRSVLFPVGHLGDIVCVVIYSLQSVCMGGVEPSSEGFKFVEACFPNVYRTMWVL